MKVELGTKKTFLSTAIFFLFHLSSCTYFLFFVGCENCVKGVLAEKSAIIKCYSEGLEDLRLLHINCTRCSFINTFSISMDITQQQYKQQGIRNLFLDFGFLVLQRNRNIGRKKSLETQNLKLKIPTPE